MEEALPSREPRSPLRERFAQQCPRDAKRTDKPDTAKAPWSYALLKEVQADNSLLCKENDELRVLLLRARELRANKTRCPLEKKALRAEKQAIRNQLKQCVQRPALTLPAAELGG